jgi:hypothetical protein
MLGVVTSSLVSAIAAVVSLQVAADEASHFSLLNKRLEAVGSNYGALPAHDGCAFHSCSSAAEKCKLDMLDLDTLCVCMMNAVAFVRVHVISVYVDALVLASSEVHITWCLHPLADVLRALLLSASSLPSNISL